MAFRKIKSIKSRPGKEFWGYGEIFFEGIETVTTLSADEFEIAIIEDQLARMGLSKGILELIEQHGELRYDEGESNGSQASVDGI